MDSPFLVLSAATISSVTVQLPDYDPKILDDIPQIERFFQKTGKFQLENHRFAQFSSSTSRKLNWFHPEFT